MEYCRQIMEAMDLLVDQNVDPCKEIAWQDMQLTPEQSTLILEDWGQSAELRNDMLQ